MPRKGVLLQSANVVIEWLYAYREDWTFRAVFLCYWNPLIIPNLSGGFWGWEQPPLLHFELEKDVNQIG